LQRWILAIVVALLCVAGAFLLINKPGSPTAWSVEYVLVASPKAGEPPIPVSRSAATGVAARGLLVVHRAARGRGVQSELVAVLGDEFANPDEVRGFQERLAASAADLGPQEAASAKRVAALPIAPKPGDFGVSAPDLYTILNIQRGDNGSGKP
jgi:hypothetical protein